MTASDTPQMTDPQQVPHVFTYDNGQKQPLTFSSQEFERRLTRARTLLSTHNLDVLVLTSMHNIKYYSDFVPTPFGRKHAVIITAEDSITVTPWVDGGMAWRTSYGENIVYSDWEGNNYYRAIQRVVDERKITPSRIGVEFDHLTLDQFSALNKWFDTAELVDVAIPVMNQRLLKSDEEVYLIRQGARIADIGGRAIKNAVREGATEYDLSMIGTQAMVPEIAKVYPGKELRETWAWLQSGINTDGAHNWATTRQLKKGDILSLNCFPMMSGHYTAMERTMFLGEPDQRSLELWELNLEAYRIGLELIKPGAVAQDIAATINRYFQGHDLLKYAPIGYGHSFGVMGPYYGREASLELREDIETVLEPGMVLSMEPMLAVPDHLPGAGGYREHDILVISDDGVENITGFEIGPEHNIID